MKPPNLIPQMNVEQKQTSAKKLSGNYSDLLLVIFPFVSIFYALRSNRYFTLEDGSPSKRFWLLLVLGYSIWAVTGFFTLKHLNYFDHS